MLSKKSIVIEPLSDQIILLQAFLTGLGLLQFVAIPPLAWFVRMWQGLQRPCFSGDKREREREKVEMEIQSRREDDAVAESPFDGASFRPLDVSCV